MDVKCSLYEGSDWWYESRECGDEMVGSLYAEDGLVAHDATHEFVYLAYAPAQAKESAHGTPLFVWHEQDGVHLVEYVVHDGDAQTQAGQTAVGLCV